MNFQARKKAFCDSFAAIFIQPAPLAATDETKAPQHEQINLESSFFYVKATRWRPLAIQVYDLVKYVRE